MSAPCIFTPFIKRGGKVAGERQRKGKSGKKAGEDDGEKRQLTKSWKMMEERGGGWVGDRGGQYQCAGHMTDALGLLLNGFPVGRS